MCLVIEGKVKYKPRLFKNSLLTLCLFSNGFICLRMSLKWTSTNTHQAACLILWARAQLRTLHLPLETRKRTWSRMWRTWGPAASHCPPRTQYVCQICYQHHYLTLLSHAASFYSIWLPNHALLCLCPVAIFFPLCLWIQNSSLITLLSSW